MLKLLKILLFGFDKPKTEVKQEQIISVPTLSDDEEIIELQDDKIKKKLSDKQCWDIIKILQTIGNVTMDLEWGFMGVDGSPELGYVYSYQGRHDELNDLVSGFTEKNLNTLPQEVRDIYKIKV